MKIVSVFQRFAADESGATAIEYVLIGALVAVAAIVAFSSLGGGLSGIFTDVANETTDAIDRADL